MLHESGYPPLKPFHQNVRLTVAAVAKKSMEIIAHRGASHDAPENTMAAIELAWQQGADAVEIDVQMASDGGLVVIHDDTTHRTAGLKKRVSDQALKELRSLEVGSWKGPRWRGERIPTLAEAFDSIPSGKRLFVEIKCSQTCVPEFVRVFKSSRQKAAGVVPIGFDQNIMRLIKAALPFLEVCQVIKFKRRWPRGPWLPLATDLIQQIRQSELDGLDCGANRPIPPELIELFHAAKLKCYVWTVDEPALARRLKAGGIDGITTNRPGWLRERLGKHSAE